MELGLDNVSLRDGVRVGKWGLGLGLDKVSIRSQLGLG